MPDTTPFGPGHPVFDAQLDLFRDHHEPEPIPELRQLQPCPACRDHAEPQGRDPCPLCQGRSTIKVKLQQVPGYWECQNSGCIVKAETEEKAAKKLGKKGRVAPAYFEYGGYS